MQQVYWIRKNNNKMRFIFCTKKDGRHIEYSNYFNTVIEAEIWYMNHGQWLEKTFNRKLELLKVHQGAHKTLIRETI